MKNEQMEKFEEKINKVLEYFWEKTPERKTRTMKYIRNWLFIVLVLVVGYEHIELQKKIWTNKKYWCFI